jgi:hypothetical protein
MSRFKSQFASAVQLSLGASFLLLSGLFAFSGEFPVPYFSSLAWMVGAFSPSASVALVTAPALTAAIFYLSPGAGWRSIAFSLLCGVLSLTPVLSGLRSWALYLGCGMAGCVLLARAVEPRLGAVALSAASRAWEFVVRARWPRFLSTAAVVHLSLTLVLSFWLFGGVPHVMDSVAQLFHAKILAGGSVAAPAPPVPEAFDYSHLVVSEGRWFSVYHLAHSFLLSLAVRVGLAPMTNPLLGIVGLVGLAYLARLVAGERIARLVVLLALVSPWWLLMHAEAMNHATAGAALTWALVLFAKAGRQESPLALTLLGAASGLLFGVAFLVRPYTPLLVGASLVCFALWRALRGERAWLLCTLIVAVAALPAVLLQLRLNTLTTGEPFLTAYVVKYGPGIAPGFHLPPWGPPHTPLLGLANVLADLNALNRWVLGLPVPLVLLVAGFRRKPSLPGWVWGVPIALLAGHFAYWYVDFCFGPRFLFEALPCILILAAVALRELWARAPQRLALVGAFALLAAPGVWTGFYRNYGRSFYGVDDHAAAVVCAVAPPDALVFVPAGGYGAYVWRNDPWLKKGPVYALDRASENGRVVASFPGRRAFRVDGDRLLPLLSP